MNEMVNARLKAFVQVHFDKKFYLLQFFDPYEKILEHRKMAEKYHNFPRRSLRIAVRNGPF